MLIVRNHHLFPNTKLTKYIPQNLIGIDLSGDLAHIFQGMAQRIGYQIGGEILFDAGGCIVEGGEGALDGLQVAVVGDEEVATKVKSRSLLFQSVD